MPQPNKKTPISLIEQMLGEASWLLSHAQALADYGRDEDAATEYARASQCEEQVSVLLEADGQDLEAAIHRVSAASCYERLGQYARAATLLRAALATPLREEYRARVEELRRRCLTKARKEVQRAVPRKRRKRVSVGGA